MCRWNLLLRGLRRAWSEKYLPLIDVHVGVCKIRRFFFETGYKSM